MTATARRTPKWLTSACLAIGFAAPLALSGTAAAAEPSVWSAAAEPTALHEGRAIARVDRWLSESELLRIRLKANSNGRRAVLLHRARRTLENVGAGLSDSTELRMRLAQTYYGLFNVEKDPRLIEQAVTQLLFVAHSNAPVTDRAEALSDLAVCYARLGKHEKEIAAYAEALAIHPAARDQALLLANRAEAYMATGRILDAVRGYRQSLRAIPSAVYRRAVTTMWGLGVALDRAGDLGGALAQITMARKYDPTDEEIRDDGWFYVPPYDESWYGALGSWQSARSSKDAMLKRAFYTESISMWRKYIATAPPNDRWLPLAGQRLSACEKERDRVRDDTAGKRDRRHDGADLR